MRAIAVLFGVVLAVALPVSRVDAASDEQRVDPYERLYGRAMARHRALEPNELSLAPEAARKMAERTQALLTREAAASLPGGPSSLPPKMQTVMAKLDENAQRSRQLLQEGRYEAAYLEATEYAFMHTLLVHLFVGMQRVMQSGWRTDGAALAALPSRLPEARGQLERMHQELQTTTPKTASQLVALLAAYANWHDAEVLLVQENFAKLVLAYKAELASAADPAATHDDILERLNRVRSPFRTAEKFLVEEIIDPRKTRSLLCEFARLAEPLRTPGIAKMALRP